MVETTIEQIGDVTVVRLTGRLHLGSSLGYAENAVNRLIDSGVRKLVIDLAGLDYMDSSGLGMLLYCSGRVEQGGGQMRVAGAAPSVARMFEIAHADRIMQLDADVDSACQKLA